MIYGCWGNLVLYWLVLGCVCVAIGILAFKKASLAVWSLGILLFLMFFSKYSETSFLVQSTLWVSILSILAIFNLTPLRMRILTHALFRYYLRRKPSLSSTEREALAAGTVGWEGDLFQGNPDFNLLFSKPASILTDTEEAFLQGPVQDLCRKIDDWQITHELADLPEEVWAFLKEKRFFGMIIPKRYGGLEFSATMVAHVLTILYGKSVSVATTVGVPNSLGPAELLLKYGTDAEKDYYLPRLATGIEIPCFALTGIEAGSDAASMPDRGIVCEKMYQGKKTQGILLNWNKRYITLCPVATVIGLAFRLFDPEHLLGSEPDLGITCALIPADTPGITRGLRHYPLNTAFMNGPTQGKDVFIPLDKIIGGAKMAGLGWRMLMECLSAGRAISLPASSAGAATVAVLASSAYAAIRTQFGVSIGKFGGIEEVLARIAGNAYIIMATIRMTAAEIDRGGSPSVASAITKYHTTELGRQVIQDAMDLHGGKAICLGPNNYLGRGYQEYPIGITVEGANILTRNLIIFGQGLIRCHAYAREELESAISSDQARFDEAIWAHAGAWISHALRSFVFGVTRVRLAPYARERVYIRLIERFSACLACISDVAMFAFGGSLKREEGISARLGDLLSYLYLSSAVIKQYKDEGSHTEDLPIVHWALQTLLYQTETTLYDLIQNFPKMFRWILKFILLPWGRTLKKPKDYLAHEIALLMQSESATRTRLTRLVFKEARPNHPLGNLEAAFHQVLAVHPLETKIRHAAKRGEVVGLTFLEQIENAAQKGILTEQEALELKTAEHARLAVLAVDAFETSALARVKTSRTSRKK